MKQILATLAGILMIVSAGATDVTGSYFAIIVNDIDASESWYRETLALEPGKRLAEAGRYEIVNLQSAGLFVELLALPAAADRPAGFMKGAFKVGMLVDDLESFVAGLPDAAGRPEVIEDADNGLLLIQLRDPDGNIVQVMQRTD